MINPIHQIKGKMGNKQFGEESLVEAHKQFMLIYGWISIEEFAKLPIPTFFNLLQGVNDEIKRRNKMAGLDDNN